MSATRVSAPRVGTARVPAVGPSAARRQVAAGPSGSVAGNGVFVLFIAGLIVAGMAVLLLLNTILAEGAFQIQALTRQQQQLQQNQQALMLYVARNESPDALARQATRFGMVPLSSPGYLRLPGGAVLGAPAPAVARRPAAPPVTPAVTGALNMAAVPSPGAADGAQPVTKPAATDARQRTSTTPASKPAKKPKPGATTGVRR